MPSFLQDTHEQTEQTALSVRHLYKSYERHAVLHDLNFTVESGSSLSIIGPSGCGKSTLLYLLSGLDTADKGDVYFYSRNMENEQSFFNLHGRSPRISYLMQDYGLFPWKNAEQNLALPLLLKKTPSKVIKARIENMFFELGLYGINSKYPAELSGGQRQRLALGRALISSPEVLLLDEPFSSVDAITREHLQSLVFDLFQKYQFTMVLVTHSITESIFLGKNVMVLTTQPSINPHAHTDNTLKHFTKIDSNAKKQGMFSAECESKSLAKKKGMYPLILQNACFGIKDIEISKEHTKHEEYREIFRILSQSLVSD